MQEAPQRSGDAASRCRAEPFDALNQGAANAVRVKLVDGRAEQGNQFKCAFQLKPDQPAVDAAMLHEPMTKSR